MKKILLVFSFCVTILSSTLASDTLTRAQVYNFSVGDTFEYRHTYTNTIPNRPPDYLRYSLSVIENLYLAPSADTLFIFRKNIWPSGYIDSDILQITRLDSFEMVQYFFTDSIGCVLSLLIDTNSQYNSRTTNHFEESGLGCIKDTIFGEGLGVVEARDGYGDITYGFSNWSTELVYYSKGTEKWGTSYFVLVGVNEIENHQFSLSPNPATTSVTISIDENLIGSTATITDVTGRTVMAVKLTTYHSPLNISDFANGIYFVTISNGSQSATRKLVVER